MPLNLFKIKVRFRPVFLIFCRVVGARDMNFTYYEAGALYSLQKKS